MIEQLLDMMDDMLMDDAKVLGMIAEVNKAYFDKLVFEGFTKDQAMKILANQKLVGQ